jgi:3-deoxy-D-manno-octulosonate 8-phosphate phosphatase (KDO 8-P phosphatase)
VAIAADIVARAARVRLVVFDVDGVLTDGRLYLGDAGQEFKVFHSRDGQGLVMLRECGVEIAIISGRSSPAVAERMEDLGIRFVYQGRTDKLAVLEGLLSSLQFVPDETAYVGDDLPDLPAMRHVGLAVAVADAHEIVAKHAHWRTRSLGGHGAAREVCDLILDSQGLLGRYESRYFLS